MKIRMLVSLGGDPNHAHGDVVDVSDAIGAAWIAERIAEPVAAADAPQSIVLHDDDAATAAGDEEIVAAPVAEPFEEPSTAADAPGAPIVPKASE